MKTSKTSREWWSETRDNPTKLARWLKAQFFGEEQAAERIRLFAEMQPKGKARTLLLKIAGQEAKHARWVEGLLRKRGIPSLVNKTTRYWKQTLPKNFVTKPLQEMAAIGAHAERMRLNRIKVIAKDPKAPADIRKVFASILPDEMFHAAAFKSMAGTKAFRAAKQNHEKGLNALGLVA